MNPLVQKISRRIYYFIGVLIFIGTSVVLADNISLRDMDKIIWEGDIDVRITASSNYKESRDTESTKYELTGSKNFDAKVTIKACGNSGSLVVTDVFWDLSNIEKESETTKEKETRCPGEPDPRSPGSSTMKEKNIEETVYKGLDCKSPEEETSVSLILQDGKYALLVGSSIYRQIQIHEEITEEINVCEGQTIPKMMRVVTTGLSSPQQIIPDTNSITIMKPPERYMLPVWPIEKRAVQKDGDTLVVKGEIGPKEVEGSDYDTETYKASWHFEGRIKCKEVLKQLTMDISYAEAFANKGLQDQAKSIKEYKKLVRDMAEQNYRAGGSGGDSSTEVSMSVGANCSIPQKKQRAFKKAVARRCLPKIIYKASLEHEKKHVYQCLKFNTEFLHGTNDPYTHGLIEVPAYLAGAEVLLKWLKENCDENQNVSDIEAKMGALKSLPILFYD